MNPLIPLDPSNQNKPQVFQSPSKFDGQVLQASADLKKQEDQNLANASLVQAFKIASSNFRSIALFSLINTAITVFGGGIRFIIGLGITQLVDAVAYVLIRDNPDIKIFVYGLQLGLDVFFCGIIFLFSYFSEKQKRWAVIIGMIVYGLDALLTLYFKDYITFAFHLYFLWPLYNSLKVINFQTKNSLRSAIDFPQNIG